MELTSNTITQEALTQERMQDLRSFWNLEDASRLRWSMNLSSTLLPLLNEELSYPDFFQDKTLQFEEQCRAIEWAVGLEIDDLYMPHLQPQAGVTIFASAFGCAVEFPEGMFPRNHFAIRADDPSDKVYSLTRPSITDKQLGEMLDFTDYFVSKAGKRFPIQITDIQSPIDSAYLIWDSSALMMAMFDHPQEVHHLMRMVTDLTIDFITEQRSRAQEFMPLTYPALWYPDGMGVGVSDDALAVLSPQTYKEFALPYLNELSEAFNGVFVHSCGNFTHQFDNLEAVHKLRGINFGATETPFEAVWERFNGKTAIVPHTGLNKDIHFATELDTIQHILQVKTHNRGLLILVSPEKICGSELDVRVLRETSRQINQLLDDDARSEG